MKWKFDNNKPIYLQIVEILKADIIANNYETGQKFPSVRELAQLASVNPNTIQKALVELERQGFVETLRTSGRVISANYDKLSDERLLISQQKVKEFLEQMYQLGFSKDQIITIIKENGDVFSGN